MADNRKDKFIESYLIHGNQTKAALDAGYSPKRAAITGSELMKDEYVSSKIRSHQELTKDRKTDSFGTVEDIFDAVGPEALKLLSEKAKFDPDAAQKFFKLKMDYEKNKEEKLGGYEGLATEEVIERFNLCIENGRDLIQRIMEAQRTDALQEGLDLPVVPSTGTSGPKEEPVGGHTQTDSQEPGQPTTGGESTIVDTTGTLEVNTGNAELGAPATTERQYVEGIGWVSKTQ